ncbi:hypothetical protein ANO11243_067940 [Dothideomycetidae sp. 11243]|nr:hypothetical protein ANO11243_067940 [fungal sp. No.11243]
MRPTSVFRGILCDARSFWSKGNGRLQPSVSGARVGPASRREALPLRPGPDLQIRTAPTRAGFDSASLAVPRNQGVENEELTCQLSECRLSRQITSQHYPPRAVPPSPANKSSFGSEANAASLI